MNNPLLTKNRIIMKKTFIILSALLISLFAFTQCNHENGEDNGGGNGNTDNTCAVVDADGNCYDTVHIGSQIWMKSNLRTTHFRDGSAIPFGSSTNTAGPWYFQPSTADAPGYSSETYGLYYSEKAVHDTRGLCPAGWHVPTLADWDDMEKHVCTHYGTYFNFVHNYGQEYYEEFEEYMQDFLEGYYDGSYEGDLYPFLFNEDIPIAKTLASQTGWSVSDYDDEAILVPAIYPEYNNSTRLSVYPAGYCVLHENTPYFWYGESTGLWTSTKYNPAEYGSWHCEFNGGAEFIWPYYADNDIGLPVRCVKD